MKTAVLALALAALFGSNAMAAGWCEGVPPGQKFKCCAAHPKAAACR